MFHYLFGYIYGMEGRKYEPLIESTMSAYLVWRSISVQKFWGTGEQNNEQSVFCHCYKTEE